MVGDGFMVRYGCAQKWRMGMAVVVAIPVVVVDVAVAVVVSCGK